MEQNNKLPVKNNNNYISEVLIYPYNARVSRKINVKLNKGMNTIKIIDLPKNLKEDSVKADIKSESEAYIKGLNMRSFFKNIITKEEFTTLLNEIKKLERNAAFINEEINRLEEEYYNLSTTQATPHNNQHYDQMPKPLFTESWTQYLDHMFETLTQKRTMIRDLLFKRIDIKKELNAKIKERDSIDSLLLDTTLGAEIIIKSETEAEAIITLNYIVSSAYWFPVYDLKISVEDNTAILTTYAVASQESGEDWNDTALSFSTASAYTNADIVKLKSWRIKQADMVVVAASSMGNVSQQQTKTLKSLSKNQFADEIADFDTSNNVIQLEQKKPSKKRERKMLKKSTAKSKKRSGKKSRSDLLTQDEVNDLLNTLSNKSDMETEMNGEIQNETIQSQDTTATEKALQNIGYNEIIQNREYSKAYLIDNKVISQEKAMKLLDTFQIDDFSYEKSLKNIFKPKKTKQSYKKTDVRTSSGGYDYRYNAIGLGTILSRNEQAKITIKSNTQPVDLVYQTVPAESKYVYLKAVYNNESDAPLLSGSVKVYMDSDFIGESFIGTVSSGEKTAFSLGIDENIKVIRREKSKREKSGIFNKQTVINYDVEIELISYKEEDAAVEVFDRLPFTKQKDDISVFGVQFNTEKPDIHSNRGILLWRVKLEQKKKHIIKFSYKVKHPENFQLVQNKDKNPYKEGEE